MTLGPIDQTPGIPGSDKKTQEQGMGNTNVLELILLRSQLFVLLNIFVVYFFGRPECPSMQINSVLQYFACLAFEFCLFVLSPCISGGHSVSVLPVWLTGSRRKAVGWVLPFCF